MISTSQLKKSVALLLAALGTTLLAVQALADQPPANSARALTNWQATLLCFKAAGVHVGENKLAPARAELAAATTNLSPPYGAMAAQFITRLDAAAAKSSDPKNPGRLKALIGLCASLRAYDAALRLQSQAESPEELADDAAYAWRLFEVGRTNAALAEYRRKVDEEAVDTFAAHYKEQIRLVEQRAANRTNIQFSLELVKEHYLRGLEEEADALGAVQELFRVLPYAQSSTQAVVVIGAIIQRLSQFGDDLGRDAWENKLLVEYPGEREACANVYLERGMRAFSAKDFPTALSLFRKVCADYPETLAYGDAQYTIGVILQQQGKFDEAIAEYQIIFPSKVRDYELDPEKSDDAKNYRHRAALRISECLASKRDFTQALAYAEQARDRYVFMSYCKSCLQESKEGLQRRIKQLQDSIAAQPTHPEKRLSQPSPGR